MNFYKREEDISNSPPISRPRDPGISGWYIAIPLTLFVVMAAGVIIGGGWLGAVRPSDTLLVYEIRGEGNATSPETFIVHDGWELRWEHSDGEIQEICWENALEKTDCYVAMHRKPIREQGSVNVQYGGTYRLHVTGTGRWTLRVYDLAAIP